MGRRPGEDPLPGVPRVARKPGTSPSGRAKRCFFNAFHQMGGTEALLKWAQESYTTESGVTVYPNKTSFYSLVSKLAPRGDLVSLPELFSLSMADRALKIEEYMNSGIITSGEAKARMDIIEAALRVKNSEELEKRIMALEGMMKRKDV